MRARPIVTGFSAVLLLIGAAECAAADRYYVTTRLSHDGAEFGKPSLLIQDGQEASIERSGDGGFSLVITPTALPNGQIRLTTSLRSTYGSINPTVITSLGQATTISSGEVEMQVLVGRVQ
jgi:hypothetical protein